MIVRKSRLPGITACIVVFFVLFQIKGGRRHSTPFQFFPHSDVSSPIKLAALDLNSDDPVNTKNTNPPPNSEVHLHPQRKPHESLEADERTIISKETVIAISTTILRPDPSFPIWLDYHLRRVDLVMIFMDDPNERSLFEHLVGNKRVKLFDGSVVEADMTPESRLIYRQVVNNEVAIAFALANNITWLMHIDIDELFYEEGNRTWQSLPNVGSVTFINHEAVPLSHEVENYFAKCTLFKIEGGRLPFMAYASGKTAVRITPAVHSAGPHTFSGVEGEQLWVRQPMILHYVTPTFERWVAKYVHYGNFSDYWFDDRREPIGITFMLRSRDVVQGALASGNWDAARRFYNSQILDAATVERYLESGDLRRITPLDDMGPQ